MHEALTKLILNELFDLSLMRDIHLTKKINFLILTSSHDMIC